MKKTDLRFAVLGFASVSIPTLLMILGWARTNALAVAYMSLELSIVLVLLSRPYAAGKGYSRAWGWLSIIGPVGLIVLLMLPSRVVGREDQMLVGTERRV